MIHSKATERSLRGGIPLLLLLWLSLLGCNEMPGVPDMSTALDSGFDAAAMDLSRPEGQLLAGEFLLYGMSPDRHLLVYDGDLHAREIIGLDDGFRLRRADSFTIFSG